MTDFGEGHYVGQMKLVLNSLLERPNIIDLTHQIEPQNIKQAAFLLKKSISFIPEKSIVQVVVDPGVGSNREILLAKLVDKDAYLLAPDNGLISVFSENLEWVKVYNGNKIVNWEISNTFHGRDVFSPLTAQIILGNSNKYFNNFSIEEIIKLNLSPKIFDGNIKGEILFFDNYGNAITNIEIGVGTINFRDKKLKINITFSDVEIGELVVYVGSMNTIEIAIRNSNFKKIFEARNNEKIILKEDY